MRHYFILMRPLWREMLGNLGQGFGLGGSSRKKKKKDRSRGASIALFILIYGMLSFYSVIYGVGLTKLLIEFGRADMFFEMTATAAPALVLLFGILQTIPTLYHESQLDNLLVLPIKPSVIIAGKVTQAYLPVLIFPFTVFFPALVSHGILTSRPWPYYLQTLPFMVLVTFAPFALVVILIMVLMRYTRFARDKDRFQMVTSVFAILLIVALSLFVNFKAQAGQAPGTGLIRPDGTSILQGNPLSYLPSSFLGQAMLASSGTWSSLLYGLLALLVNGASLVLLLGLARRLYIPGVLGMSAGAKKTKALNLKEQKKVLKARSPYWALASKEVKLLLRTPAFFTQTVLAAILLPGLIVAAAFISLVELERSGDLTIRLLPFLRVWAQSGMWKDTLWILVLAVTGLASFFSGTNMMSASAISRQGKLFAYAKLMPVPIKIQVLAWLTPGFFTMTLLWVLLSLGLTLFLQASWLLGLVVFTIAWTNAYLVQMVSFYTDMVFPILDWTNEIQPVKNTKAAMVSGLGIFIYMGLAAVLSFLVLWLSGGRSWVTALSLFILALLLDLLISWMVVRRAGKLFHQLDI